jgi:hypothetical protein
VRTAGGGKCWQSFSWFWFLFVLLGLPFAGGRLAFRKTGGAHLASEAVAPVFLRSLSLSAVKLLCRELGDL